MNQPIRPEDVELLRRPPPRFGDLGGPRRLEGLERVRAIVGSVVWAGTMHLFYGGVERRGAAFLGAWLAIVGVVGRVSFRATLALALLLGVASAVDLARQPVVKLDKWSNPWLVRRIGASGFGIAVALFLRKYYVENFRIPAGSMIPTLMVEDRIFVDKTGWQPRRGEVVVFVFPVERDKDFVKRVIGLPGDRVSIRDHEVRVNDRPLGGALSDEPCTYPDYDEESRTWSQRRCWFLDEAIDGKRWRAVHDFEFGVNGGRKNGEFVVKAGELFVLGDNRDNSYDSRFWGGVPIANVKGRATVIWNREGAFTWSPVP